MPSACYVVCTGASASQAVLLAARLFPFPIVDSERAVEHIACRPGKLAQAAPLPPRLASPHTDTPGTATSFHHNVSIVDGQSSPELGAYGVCAIPYAERRGLPRILVKPALGKPNIAEPRACREAIEGTGGVAAGDQRKFRMSSRLQLPRWVKARRWPADETAGWRTRAPARSRRSGAAPGIKPTRHRRVSWEGAREAA